MTCTKCGNYLIKNKRIRRLIDQEISVSDDEQHDNDQEDGHRRRRRAEAFENDAAAERIIARRETENEEEDPSQHVAQFRQQSLNDFKLPQRPRISSVFVSKEPENDALKLSSSLGSGFTLKEVLRSFNKQNEKESNNQDLSDNENRPDREKRDQEVDDSNTEDKEIMSIISGEQMINNRSDGLYQINVSF